MCGLIGRITDRRGVNSLSVGLPWLDRRGPDSQSLWASGDGAVELLHARLAIVDLDPKANQPLSNQAAGVTVAMVGEIYNYREIKTQLAGYEFRTESDTEVALALYVTHGVSGLQLMKGMFTLAVVDENMKRVFLLRDAVGKKPLYIARWGGEVYFGSSLLPLCAIAGGGQAINEDMLCAWWHEGFILPNSSILKNARAVAPGTMLELDFEGSEKNERRVLPVPELVYTGEDRGAVVDNLRELIRQSVRRRLQNNPAPAALLSGGIDSTVVCDLAVDDIRDRNKNGLESITLGSLVPLMNDEFYARYAAKRLDIHLNIVRLRPEDLAESVFRIIDLQDEPLGMASFFFLASLVELASEIGRILLTGDGGDEVFLGYGKTEDWRDSPEQSPELYFCNVQSGPADPEWMSQWARKVTNDTLVGHMFAKADRASAEQGVELRCPLLDWDVMAYARSLPFGILAAGHKPKSLLKEVLKEWPGWFLERRKIGFAYNLRWAWGLRDYAGLREKVSKTAVETFGDQVPVVLRKDPKGWRRLDIFRNFASAWKLLSWSSFNTRVDATRAAGIQKDVRAAG